MGRPRFPLLFLVGVGHCGSTLLGSLLHAHPRVACVGEMARIGEALAAGRACSCGAPLAACPFWTPLLAELGRAGTDAFALSPERYARVRAATGADVLLDTSKSILVRMVQRWFGPWRADEPGYLFMVRDSRGVLAAPLREGKALAPRLRKHEKWMKRLVRFAARKGERVLRIHYEDLCAAPERELARVCAWAGLDFDPAMLRPTEHAHHFVYANPMRYLGRTDEIRLDERWRRELDGDARARIEAVMARIPLLRERYLEPASARSGAAPGASQAR